ncbi:MAG TPA: 16S rRNA (guanine(527)-N(7))-methyltransferase RsmG [Terriglobia bacterium]|nr:16S rRNA (guanine(527)-N(7))-methyltransferase RsmG [Terriglobia bacterium]
MISEAEVHNLLIPFGLDLKVDQISQLLAYLDLLLRWNRSINLTAVRTPEECVTRHFGESLYLARWLELKGTSLDVGSGAGFPGLALKIVFPALESALLEPVAKKRAFLKEVIRTCEFESVEVRPERLEELVGHGGRDIDELRPAGRRCFDSITMRAVGRLPSLVGTAACCLKSGGRLCLWVGREQASELIEAEESPLVWQAPIAVPLAAQRQILVGVKLVPARVDAENGS